MKRTTTRNFNGVIGAYDVSESLCGPLEPTVTWRLKFSDEHQSQAVTPNLDRAVYTTFDSVVCLRRDGGLLWSYDLRREHSSRDCSCVFSLDGAWLWVYCPDAMADRGPDTLFVLRADTGQEVARKDLTSVGEGGELFLHPDGQHVLLNVGEGQDGVKLYRAALTGEGIELHSYAWNDHVLIDVAPNGQWLMTVDHGRYNVAFHVLLSGEVVLQIPVEAFGYEYFGDDEACIDWSGGFLNADIAFVTIAGEKDDKEWHRRYSIDLRTGQSRGHFEAHSRDSHDFEPLGDGTWIVSGPNGSPVRHRWSTTDNDI